MVDRMSLFVRSNLGSIHPAMVAANQAKSNPLDFMQATAKLDAAAQKRREAIVNDLVSEEVKSDTQRRIDALLAEASAETASRIESANQTISAERQQRMASMYDRGQMEDVGGLESELAYLFGDPSMEHLDEGVDPIRMNSLGSKTASIFRRRPKYSELDLGVPTDARLLGIAREDEPETSYLLEQYAANPRSRAIGGGIGLGLGALGGAGAGALMGRMASARPAGLAARALGGLSRAPGLLGRMGARGLIPALGGLAGGALGATLLAPKPSIVHNIGTGDRLGRFNPERMQVQLLNRQLDPGSDPSNVSVFNADSVIGDRFPGQKPLDFGYAIDLDDALLEDPNLPLM
jgi:hypothetical protein